MSVAYTSRKFLDFLPAFRRLTCLVRADNQRTFAWTTWTSTRKTKEGEVASDLYGFLTCEPNAEVGVFHPKPMPVILTEPEELQV